MTKTFTLAEAETLIPRLEQTAAAVFELRAKAEAKLKTLAALEKSGDAAQFAIERGQAEFLARSLEQLLTGIEALGASIKGMDPLLVDFAYIMEGRKVWLCWRQGENNIRHWHGLEEGFAGRRPLPDSLLPN